MNIRTLAKPLFGALAGIVLMTGAAAAASAVSTTSLNVRSGPSTGYHAVDVLHRGERVDVQRCRGSWCYITHSGRNGWVSANYLSRGYVAPRRPAAPSRRVWRGRSHDFPNWGHHDRRPNWGHQNRRPNRSHGYRSGNSVTFGFSFGN